MKKQKFYGVNNVHTMQIPNDDDLFYVGMNVQSNTRRGSEEIVMIISNEQMIEMMDYFNKRMSEKNLEHPK